MSDLLQFINNIMPYITVGLLVAVLLLIIIIIVILNSLSSLEKKYKKFMRGLSSRNIEEVIMEHFDRVENVMALTEKNTEILEKIDSKYNNCVQKVSIKRYKAFENVGSDLSFSLAILDGNNDGVVLTSIYGRHESTTYAKPIDKGISKYDLSEEEQFVLNEAMNK